MNSARNLIRLNPLDAGRRYTGFAQTFKTVPDTGIPGLRKFPYVARNRYTGFA